MLLFVLKNRFPWASQHRGAGTRTRKSLLGKAAGREVGEVVSAHHVQTARFGAALAAQGLCHVPSEDGQVLGEPAERGGKALGQWQGHRRTNRWRTEPRGVQDLGEGPSSRLRSFRPRPLAALSRPPQAREVPPLPPLSRSPCSGVCLVVLPFKNC